MGYTFIPAREAPVLYNVCVGVFVYVCTLSLFLSPSLSLCIIYLQGAGAKVYRILQQLLIS